MYQNRLRNGKIPIYELPLNFFEMVLTFYFLVRVIYDDEYFLVG